MDQGVSRLWLYQSCRVGGYVLGDIREEEFNINSFTAGGEWGVPPLPHSLCQHFIALVVS